MFGGLEAVVAEGEGVFEDEAEFAVEELRADEEIGAEGGDGAVGGFAADAAYAVGLICVAGAHGVSLEEEGHVEHAGGGAEPLGEEGGGADVEFGAAGETAHFDADGEARAVEFDEVAEDVGGFGLVVGGEEGAGAGSLDDVAVGGEGVEGVVDFDAGVGAVGGGGLLAGVSEGLADGVDVGFGDVDDELPVGEAGDVEEGFAFLESTPFFLLDVFGEEGAFDGAPDGALVDLVVDEVELGLGLCDLLFDGGHLAPVFVLLGVD